MAKQLSSLKMSPESAIKRSLSPAPPNTDIKHIIDPKGDTIIVLQNPDTQEVIKDQPFPWWNTPRQQTATVPASTVQTQSKWVEEDNLQSY